MQRYQSQFVKATGVSTPRKLSLLSLQAKFTALQFFVFSTVPWAASASCSSFAPPGGGGSSSSSSASPAPAAASGSPSMVSPSIAARVASSSSSSASSCCFTPIDLARSINQSARLRWVCLSSAGMAPSIDIHSTCDSELAPLTTFFATMASKCGSGLIISCGSCLFSSQSLPSLRTSFLSSSARACRTARWISSSVRGRPPHF
mmetsp:Transcript_24488/g.55731  ORF Transcript_24488/g.55731 Transcript_24488/m.55731 type:complete len:204 (-) Transcript_24488:64-675(-)